MKKIPSLFKRDYEGNRQVYDEVVEGSEWVVNGEGAATVKWDGTSCMVQDSIMYKRYDVKKGRAVPEDAIPCEPSANDHTGHWPHWVKIGEGPEDKWHREGFNDDHYNDGTYELIGPKVQKGKYDVDNHSLRKHGEIVLSDFPRTFESIKAYLAVTPMEGVVWHHPDGRMVKIKRKDFGLSW